MLACELHALARESNRTEVGVMVDFLGVQLNTNYNEPYYLEQKALSDLVVQTLPKEAVAKLPRSLIESFIHANTGASNIPSALSQELPRVRLITPNQSRHRFDAGRFPIFSISRVGFSNDGQYAMLCLNYVYASLGATCDLYVLKWNPKKGHWDLTKLKFNVWVS